MNLQGNRTRALLIAVSFRSAELVSTLVDSLGRLDEFSALQVLMADNASGAETVAAIRRTIRELPNVELLESTSNRGYFGAASFALDHYLTQGRALPEWVIVSNPDITIEDREFLEKLFHLDSSSAGVIAPRIIVPASSLNQNPYMTQRPGRLKRLTMRLHAHDYLVCKIWDWLSRAKQGVRSFLMGVRQAGNKGGRIYAPHGAFIIFSRKYFESGGYLDDELFLYGEEIAVGEICRRLGLPVVYNPSLTVFHNEHQSVGVGMTRAKFQHHRQSIRHVLSKYLTPPSVATKV